MSTVTSGAPSVKPATLLCSLSPSGNWFVLSGDTFDARGRLHSLGYAWDGDRKLWKKARPMFSHVRIECEEELCWLEKTLSGKATIKPVNLPEPIKPAPSTGPQAVLLASVNGLGENGVLQITSGKKSNRYYLDRIHADFGRGYQLEKIGQKAIYHVNVGADHPSCDCIGHTQHGHCKHVAAILELEKQEAL